MASPRLRAAVIVITQPVGIDATTHATPAGFHSLIENLPGVSTPGWLMSPFGLFGLCSGSGAGWDVGNVAGMGSAACKSALGDDGCSLTLAARI